MRAQIAYFILYLNSTDMKIKLLLYVLNFVSVARSFSEERGGIIHCIVTVIAIQFFIGLIVPCA